MRLQRKRLVRWLILLLVLGVFRAAQASNEMNDFRLENVGRKQNPTAEQMIENQKNQILEALYSDDEDQHLPLPQDPLNSDEAELNDIAKGGRSRLICLIKDDFNCEDRIRELTSNKRKIMARMNMSKGHSKVDHIPYPGAYFVRSLYPLYLSKNKTGVILYIGVSSNRRRSAGLKDIARALDLLKKEDDNAYAHIGAIYLMKF